MTFTWLAQISAHYGEPSIVLTAPIVMTDSNGNTYTRIAGWTWFPGKRNHSITIDSYDRPDPKWTVRIASHTNKPQVTCTLPTEPDDEVMVVLLQVTRFLE